MNGIPLVVFCYAFLEAWNNDFEKPQTSYPPRNVNPTDFANLSDDLKAWCSKNTPHQGCACGVRRRIQSDCMRLRFLTKRLNFVEVKLAGKQRSNLESLAEVVLKIERNVPLFG